MIDCNALALSLRIGNQYALDKNLI